MNRRQVRAAGLIVGTVSLLTIIWMAFGTHSVSIEEHTIQTMLDEKLAEKNTFDGKRLMVSYSLTVDDAELVLQAGNAMMISGAVHGDIKDRPVSTDFTVTGSPVYRNGAFYFEPDEFDLQNFSLESRGEDAKTDVASTVIGILTKASGKSEDNIEDMAKGIVLEQMEERAPAILSRVPLFKLSSLGTKGTVASMALKDFVVSDGSVTITFSLLLLTMNLIIILLVVVATVGFVIVAPGAVMLLGALGGGLS